MTDVYTFSEIKHTHNHKLWNIIGECYILWIKPWYVVVIGSKLEDYFSGAMCYDAQIKQQQPRKMAHK